MMAEKKGKKSENKDWSQTVEKPLKPNGKSNRRPKNERGESRRIYAKIAAQSRDNPYECKKHKKRGRKKKLPGKKVHKGLLARGKSVVKGCSNIAKKGVGPTKITLMKKQLFEETATRFIQRKLRGGEMKKKTVCPSPLLRVREHVVGNEMGESYEGG